MKKALAVLVAATMAVVTVNVQASDPWNPESKFNMSKNKVKNFQISVNPVPDVNKACNDEAKKRGFKPYNFSVDACTFWSGDHKQCDIYTQTNTTMHILGHELRHCLVGEFH